MKDEAPSMNKMGTAPVKGLMLGMGLPMILSMMLQALYNIVDTYFVSSMAGTAEIPHMGDYAVNALTLAFPIQMLMIAVGVGTGVGINALLSRSLGQGDREKASVISGNAIFLGLCTYVVFLLFGLFGVKAYLGTQTSDPIILEMGTTYLQICCIMSIGVVLYMIFEKLLQGTGRTGLSTIGQVAGALTNIVLDPVLIFGCLGFPEMGIAGAAWATVIGQMVSCLLDLLFHCLFNRRDISIGPAYLKPRRAVIRDIYVIGIPAIVMQALMSAMTYGINIIFGAVSTAAVTAYGTYYKIQQFIFFAAFGMNNALIPIISFNYGKGDRGRVQDGIKYGMLDTLVIMALGAAGLQILAKPLVGLFSLAPETQVLCLRAIRMITLGYLFVGANIAFQGIFQALGCGVRSLLVSLIRLIVAALPLAWILTRLANAEAVIWAAFPIAEGLALVIALFLMRQIARQRLSSI